MIGNAAPLATIVMYHVVRPAAAGLFPRLKGLDLSAFREQLLYIRAHYTIVGLFDLVAAPEAAQPLPPPPTVLSLDDGYTRHYEWVFPLLVASAVPAAFFT